MLHAPAQVIEYRPGSFHVGRLAADKSEELALHGWSDSTADGALDERGAFRADFRRERLLRLGANGAHVDEELSPHFAGEQAVAALIRSVDRDRVGEHRDDDLCSCRQLGGRCRHARARQRERFRFLARAVPYDHAVTDAEQAAGHRRTHSTRACDTDYQWQLHRL